MLPPSPVRRLVLVPLVVAIAGALAALALPLALLSAAFNLVRHRLRKEDGAGTGRRHRMRALRVVCFALVWAVGETAALTPRSLRYRTKRPGCRADPSRLHSSPSW